MSEYQYYEFQAVDRPLTVAEIADLRALSSRATITPTRLQNVYHYGSFRGDPLLLMERYFDAFVYIANWGTRQLMLRLPRALIDPRTVGPYEVEEGLEAHVRGEAVILEFRSEDEEGADWIEDEEAAQWLPALLPLRAALMAGDQRPFYISWLAGVACGAVEDEELEPPVPPGLGSLDASLTTLASFLRVADDLLAVAATGSAAPPAPLPPEAFARWITALPLTEKDALLARLAEDPPPNLRAELLGRFRRAHRQEPVATAARRPAGALLVAAQAHAETRRRQEAARAAAARATQLSGLAGREHELWAEVDALIAAKRPQEYDRAVSILTDLRDLGAQAKDNAAFGQRVAALRGQYRNRPSLIERLDRAGLRG